MSVREEDRQKNCPSRGLGIAAAAIGVGVGAALYYFFNKRSENPDGEGSTSNWSCEQRHTLQYNHNEEDDSYATISEHSTTDTSMHETSADSINTEINTSFNDDTESNSSYTDMSTGIGDTSDSDSSTVSDMSIEDVDVSLDSDFTQLTLNTERLLRGSVQVINDLEELAHGEGGYSINRQTPAQPDSEVIWPWVTIRGEEADSDTEWNVATSPADNFNDNMPSMFPMFLESLNQSRSKIKTEEDQMSMIRDQAFRERDWTVEECSICFEVVLKNQEVMELPCTHRFHQQCILPWLQEKQTCPNCRKMAECKFIPNL